MEEEQRKAQNRALKEQINQNIECQKKNLEYKLKNEADNVKLEKKEQKDLMHMQKQQDYLKNTSLKHMIKSQQKEA